MSKAVALPLVRLLRHFTPCRLPVEAMAGTSSLLPSCTFPSFLKNNPHRFLAVSASFAPSNPTFRSTPDRLRTFPSIWRSEPSRRWREDGVLVACLPSTDPSPPPPPSTASDSPRLKKLYVSGLSYHTTQESLRDTFQKFGKLVKVKLIMDRIANRTKGYAFVEYSTRDEAVKAIEGMHGKFLDGRVIFVEFARPREDS